MDSATNKDVKVAIIMDGNGRWAKKHGVPITQGHRAGGDTLREITKAALDLGVSELTVYAFSTENWARSKQEVDGIMELFIELVSSEAPEMKKRNSRMCFTGRRDELSQTIQSKMKWAEELTIDGTDMTLCIAFNYGGRAEIVDAANQLLKAGHSSITEDMLSDALYRTDLGDPDLIIRTAGELRMSNFLTWQAAYSEFIFSDKLWPDFTGDDLASALNIFKNRDRRFGKRDEKQSSSEVASL